VSVLTVCGFAVSDPCGDDNWHPVPLATKAVIDLIVGTKPCLCNGNPAPVPELRLRRLDNYVSAPAPAQGDGHARPSV
jgi:hypothetical protein